ncbi:MAG: hypothetical protein JW971_03910, partial [Synergistales bacterium]|nr:hypothetical protein [Synergistales bacterium]
MRGKYNAKDENMLCWGRNTVLSLLESKPELCISILLASNSKGEPIERIREKASMGSIKVDQVTAEKISTICGDENHQGVVG